MGSIGSFVRRELSGGWEVSDRLYERIGVADGRFLIVWTNEMERRMGGF